MKNLKFISLVMLVAAFTACAASGEKVSPKVQQAFAQKFPKAKKVKWEMENKTEWEAEFEMDAKEYSANFDLEGTWLETEYEIELADLPANIKAALDAEYAGYDADEIEIEISETAEAKVYEIVIENDGKETELTIDLNGKIIKSDVANEEDGSDEDAD